MKAIRIIVCLILLLGLFGAQFTAVAAEPARFSPEISPGMELLSGVLAQTTWINHRGPSGNGNKYYQALKEFFVPYREHEAVKIAQELTTLGFTYDAPVGFLCHLGELPKLELKYEYSDYLSNRAQGRERLERFRVALRDLAKESDFLKFYQSWQPKYEQWIAATNMDGVMVVSWLEGFFGKQAAEFHLIFAPAMFPGGGYGAIVTAPTGAPVCYQIIREPGQSTADPSFPTGKDLEYLSLHEWGHSFVNPAIDAYASEVQRLSYLYQPVVREMSQMAYPSVSIFMNEQVLRAVTTLAAEQVYGKAMYNSWLQAEQARSFYLTDEIITLLRAYQADRANYPTFENYVPVLLQGIAQMKALSDQRVEVSPWMLALVGAAGAAFALWRRKRARVSVPPAIDPPQS